MATSTVAVRPDHHQPTPIHFTASQVEMMAEIAAIFDETRKDFPPEYFNLQQNEKGGFEWMPR